MFAGPNGSGKTTILKAIRARYDFGYYVNADDIEKQLSEIGYIALNDFGIEIQNDTDFQNFITNHSLYKKALSADYGINLRLNENKIYSPDKSTHSYEAALIADMMRYQLMDSGKKFTFETVMSHPSKVDFLEQAQIKNYKNYLYFVSTESPLINVRRVRQRVQLGGHPVDEDKIQSRYFASLDLLQKAIQHTYRTFIFDNTEDEFKLILEIFEGNEVTYRHNEIPHWVDRHVFNR